MKTVIPEPKTEWLPLDKLNCETGSMTILEDIDKPGRFRIIYRRNDGSYTHRTIDLRKK